MLKVKDIYTKNTIACQAETSVREAARLMFLNGLTGLPVIDSEDHLVGIVTEGDLIKKQERLHIPTMLGFLGSLIYLDNPANGDEIEKQLHEILATKVGELMSHDIITVEAETPLEDLVDIFLKKKANPVPVMKDGKIVGIVSRADIVKLLAGEDEMQKNGNKALANE